jgi:hypothetical protein
MSGNKTVPTGAGVEAHLAGVADEGRRADGRELLELLRRVTGCEPALWGPSLVGFDAYRYRYASGREGEWFAAGFACRKDSLVLNLMQDFPGRAALLAELGRHRAAKGYIYIKRLGDVDRAVLERLVAAGWRAAKAADDSAG